MLGQESLLLKRRKSDCALIKQFVPIPEVTMILSGKTITPPSLGLGRQINIHPFLYFPTKWSLRSTALKPHNMVATAARKKRIVTQMLAWVSCDHLLSIIEYSQPATTPNVMPRTTHLIDEVMVFNL
ncbi:MAG TPA: hypothetical protein VEV15_06830 [Flavisolibacter sp.]|nr:hypothetical protein [Flavisolibacter sp.]